MPYPYKPANNAVFAVLVLADVSTASSVRFAPGFNGRIRRITSCLGGAITGADSALTTAIGSAAVTGGSWTVAFTGSATNDVDQAIPTAANIFSATDAIVFTTDGGSTGTQTLTITAELEPI